MIFTEEDSERNAELKKNLSVPPLNFDEETLKEINNNFKNGRLEKVREIFDNPLEKDFEAANVSDNPLKGELSDAVAELFSFLLKENKNDGSLVQVLPGGYDEKTD